MKKFGIGRARVVDIKKKRTNLMDFKRQVLTGTVKSRKLGEYPKLDQAVFVWFKQKTAEGIPCNQWPYSL